MERTDERSKKMLLQAVGGKDQKELPDLYESLCMNFYNPYEEQCQQTKTHYILVSSAIEYFIHK